MSAAAKYTDLFNEVLPEVPGVGNALAENAIRNTVIRFCIDSWVWQYDPDKQDVAIGQTEYDLEPAPGADVVEVVSLAIEGAPLSPLTLEQANIGEAGFTLNDDATVVTIYPEPEEFIEKGMSFTLALMPRRASSSFPGWIFSNYLDALAAGAKARLLRMPSKPWSAQKAGDSYLGEFLVEVAKAKENVLRTLAQRNIVRSTQRTTTQH